MNNPTKKLTNEQIQEIAAEIGVPVGQVREVAQDHQLIEQFIQANPHFSDASAVQFIAFERAFHDE